VIRHRSPPLIVRLNLVKTDTKPETHRREWRARLLLSAYPGLIVPLPVTLWVTRGGLPP
jgi:hypothetical protein